MPPKSLAQKAWEDVLDYSTKNSFYLRKWLETEGGKKFKEAIQNCLDDNKVPTSFRAQVNMRLTRSDAEILEFFHNQKAYFIRSVRESENKPFFVPDLNHNSLSPQEHVAWRTLDTLFGSEKGPLNPVYRQLKHAVSNGGSFDSEAHRFWILSRLRETMLHLWNAEEQFSDDFSLLSGEINEKYGYLLQIAQDIQFLNFKPLADLHESCCENVKTLAERKNITLPTQLVADGKTQCVMCPSLKYPDYKAWLREKIEFQSESQKRGAEIRKRYMYSLIKSDLENQPTNRQRRSSSLEIMWGWFVEGQQNEKPNGLTKQGLFGLGAQQKSDAQLPVPTEASEEIFTMQL